MQPYHWLFSTKPPHKTGLRGWRWLAMELRDHLWPWSPQSLRGSRALLLAGALLAVAVSLAWLLAATGRLSGMAIVAWWLAWSAYEVAIRMQAGVW